MRIVNTTERNVYTRYAGMLKPGQISSDKGPYFKKLINVLGEIVRDCKDSLGIRLDKDEMDLLNRLIDLDEMGSKFDPETIPESIRKDPNGVKHAEEEARIAQQKSMDKISRQNETSLRRESIINGEVREAVGPATLKGVPVDPSMIKSGFEKLMEENERIAAGKKKIGDVNEILDPIGVHAANADVGNSSSEEIRSIGKDPVSVPQAKGRQDDVTRTADADIPKPVVPKPNKMDEVAADIAGKISTFGPVDNGNKEADGPEKKPRGRGRKPKSK